MQRHTAGAMLHELMDPKPQNPHWKTMTKTTLKLKERPTTTTDTTELKAGRITTTVSSKQIKRHDDFVIRKDDLDDTHVRDLSVALRNNGTLDPILLWRDIDGDPASNEYVLVDGEYRLRAYKKADIVRDIPATILTCTRTEALLEATVEAHKVRKNLSYRDRSDRAWFLIRDAQSKFSKAELVRSTGVGKSTIDRMRARPK